MERDKRKIDRMNVKMQMFKDYVHRSFDSGEGDVNITTLSCGLHGNYKIIL